MNFNQRVMDVTRRELTPHIITSIAGQYAGRRYQAWVRSPEYAKALQTAQRLNGHLRRPSSLQDKRTRGYKHLQAAAETFFARYAKTNPPQPGEGAPTNFIARIRL